MPTMMPNPRRVGGVETSAHFFKAQFSSVQGRYLLVSTLACLQVTVTHWLRERSELDVGGGELARVARGKFDRFSLEIDLPNAKSSIP